MTCVFLCTHIPRWCWTGNPFHAIGASSISLAFLTILIATPHASMFAIRGITLSTLFLGNKLFWVYS
jgi:hypothetical protein